MTIAADREFLNFCVALRARAMARTARSGCVIALPIRPRRVDGTYVKRTRSVEGPTFNGANKILEIIVTPEPTPNPPLDIMKSPEHLGFGSNYRSLYFIFGLKVRPKTLTSHALGKSPNLAELSQRVGS